MVFEVLYILTRTAVPDDRSAHLPCGAMRPGRTAMRRFRATSVIPA